MGYVIEILANRIIKGGLNPKTNLPLMLEDIKEEYRESVELKITELMTA